MKSQRFPFKSEFKVGIANLKAQAAEMVLSPKGVEGGPDNRHKGSDQWMFVVSGNGSATINGEYCKLTKGTLVLIEKGKAHEIRNTGRTPLKTLNLYIPPAYAPNGEPLKRASK
jgi:mannose-6-phosphate isomerase-like protein (cupin superfamily)